jgi:MFS family permease
MKPLSLYLAGTGAWFMAFGLQSVMFAWLVTMVLLETPQKVGFAQTVMLLPGTLLILVGGSFADRIGGKRIAVGGQLVAVLGPLLLIAVLLQGELSYNLMLCYAVLMGTANAFVTPGRDGLLNSVAQGRVQRAVMLTSIAQFGMQMFGFVVAYFADVGGPILMLSIQTVVLLLGALALSRLPADTPKPVTTSLLESVKEGARTVFGSSAMRMVALQNIVMAICFMGSYIVTMPLLVREVFDGSASDLALVNGANSIGLVSTIIVMLRFGDIRRQGRALLIAQLVGACVLAIGAFVTHIGLLMVVLFAWGMCGGMAMTMSRTIMQEQAPADQRGRVMGFYAFTFMGAGPLGALINGFLVDAVGAQTALLCASVFMLLVIVLVSVRSELWRIQGAVHEG